MSKRIVLLASALLLAGLSVGVRAPAKAPAGGLAPAAAVADPGRSDSNRKMDEGRMPEAILSFAGFKPGEVVADWGAGGGYYSEMIADVVGPKGRVYAIGAPAYYKADVWNALVKAHPNVMPLVAPAEAQQLAPGSVDAIFAHLEYHDLYFVSEKARHPKLDVPAVLANWFAAVRPGGHVIVVDHVALPGDPWENTNKYHRIDPEQVKRDLTAAGFVLEGESDVLHRSDDPHNVLVFDPSVRGKTDRFALKFKKPG
ncbi:MAG: class I SAM-dependent methyltransferase [Sphingomonadales bacterium]|nr:class I SAM-dependent methyltransferase [Sphingomonadales bacterium]MDE2570008.1 class I SAM-dependent methyltransferase [Sphingomonadales bacterium]